MKYETASPDIYPLLEGKGYKVIRFSNEDVLYDTDMTINKIKEALRHE